jgi:HEAT repeat protein
MAESLRADLLDHQPGRCIPALEIVMGADEPARFKGLCAALPSQNPVVGSSAAEALESYGEAAVMPLIQAIDTSHILVKLRVVRALDAIGSPQAVLPLLALLKSTEHVPVRYTLIEALGNLGDASLAGALRPYLDDADHHVREKTQIALEKLMA